jgi:dihydropteroate synthase
VVGRFNMTTLRCGDSTLELGPGHRPLIMGIVNVTPDSMSDGGLYVKPQDAVRHAHALLAAGADVLDIGGESTRPGAAPVSVDEEISRVLPVIDALVAQGCRRLCIDTQHGPTAAAALAAGASWINDVSGGDDPQLLVAARRADALVLMHRLITTPSQRTPRGDDVHYEDVVAAVGHRLQQCIDRAVGLGVDDDRIVVDPGLGFGKSVTDNLRLLRAGRTLFQQLGRPVLVGASRKRFLGAITHEDDPSQRDVASVAAAVIAVEAGAHIVRVHDVRMHQQAMQVWAAQW